ncbi:MAG: LLM class F420-dependent oxidoreductase [Acidimicrobiaceae bacterium]|nr:LLM class F420-dependent oxidoreductase [Acidimicrobiaceae bacterium]
MKLGLNTGYWSAGPPAGATEQIAAADRLGFDSIWTAEAYGSDCFTPLAWWGAATERVLLGTSITQMSARTPAATAMAAMSLDHLSGGRFVLGVGASGPQVVEGWYGRPYSRPLARTREYVDIVRQVVSRAGPVAYDGDFYQLPYTGQGSTGLGKSLKSTVHPLRSGIPIYLGAEGPKNVALAAEICDGWLAWLFSPRHDAMYRSFLDEGFGRPGARRSPDDFEVVASTILVPGDDMDACADFVRPVISLYVGGMGAKGTNFHRAVFDRMGYEAQCDTIQDLYLAGDKAAATAAVTTQMCEEIALIGPWSKIAEDLEAWRSSVVTTLLISGDPATLERFAELAG